MAAGNFFFILCERPQPGRTQNRLQNKASNAGLKSSHLLNFMENAMSRTPNDDRSDSLNPNNDAYDSSMDNHANQLNPNNDAYQGSNNGDDDEED